MPLFAIPYPYIDPVAIAVGPFAVRWYALAYIVGLVVGWRFCLFLADRPPQLVARRDVDDFLAWATLGIVLGGRGGRRRRGVVPGLSLAGCGVGGLPGDFSRQPAAQRGYLIFGRPRGQPLSTQRLLGGIAVIGGAGREPTAAAAAPPRRKSVG